MQKASRNTVQSGYTVVRSQLKTLVAGTPPKLRKDPVCSADRSIATWVQNLACQNVKTLFSYLKRKKYCKIQRGLPWMQHSGLGMNQAKKVLETLKNTKLLFSIIKTAF